MFVDQPSEPRPRADHGDDPVDRARLARGFISELDGLRGIAILLVMVHRFWPRTGTGVVAEAAGAGWIGVDLFFVISGFLITGILLDTRGEAGFFKNFYVRRVLRIFPLFYLFVIGVWIAFSGNPAFREHAGSPAWYLLHLGNVPESLLGKDVPYWLAPVWSLAIEEQFYLTFPLLVWLVGRRWLAHVLVAMIVAAPLFRLGTMLAVPDQERIQYLFTLSRIDTLAIGCLLAVIARSIDIERRRVPATRLLAAAFLGSVVLLMWTGLDRTTAFGRVLGYSVVAVGCAGAVGLVVLWRGAPGTGLLRVRPLRYLGKLCFGLYLLHRPADTIVSALADRAGIDADLRIMPLKIAVAVVFATGSWWLIETRFLRLKRRFASAAHPAEPPAGRATSTEPAARALRVGLLVSVLACAGCGQGGTIHGGAVLGSDARASDAIAFDAARDGSPGDAPSDGAPVDAVVIDGVVIDAMVIDAVVMDAVVIDAAVSDAGAADAAPVDAAPDASPSEAAPVLYVEGTRHSPLTPAIAQRLQTIAAVAPHQGRVFAKIGDSITAAAGFLHCFDGGAVDLGAHAALADTRSYYLGGDAAGSSPFARSSLAAIGGSTSHDAVTGAPTIVESELAAIDPCLAVVLFGTNDVRYGRTLDEFGADLWELVDLLVARGIIPIVSTVPANNGDPVTDVRIPTFNRVIRAIAQGRGVPLVDLHHELAALPSRGLSSDGLHPSVAPGGGCLLTSEGLTYGYNVRNLLTIEALARVRSALAGVATDASAPTRIGSGLAADPVRGTLPIVDLADTRTGEASIASYSCGGPAQPGREIVYRLELTAQVTLVAHVVDRGSTDVDVHVLGGGLGGAACIASGDRDVTATVGPGTVFVVVDSPSTEGEYLIVVSAD